MTQSLFPYVYLQATIYLSGPGDAAGILCALKFRILTCTQDDSTYLRSNKAHVTQMYS